MKKILILLTCLILTACTNANKNIDDKQTITITSLNASKENTTIEVPFNPNRIAVMDHATLDILDTLGLNDKIVATSDVSIDYLHSYKERAILGTIKEANLEKVIESQPDIIFIGGRLAESYDILSEIAPVVYLGIDYNKGVVNSIYDNAKVIASIFDIEDKVDTLLSQYDTRIENLKNISKNQDAIISLTTSGSFNLLTDDGRLSLIGKEIGFNNLANSDSSSSHGNEASFELVKKLDPEYIFVLDRDVAINASGSKFAKDIVENDLVKSTKAYQNNHIIYLSNPSIWYTAEGGIKALDIMLSDLEEYLLKS